MLDDNNIRLFKHVNLGVAVDTPRGLMVPTIFHADEMSLLEISKAVKELAAQCREGNISPDKLTGGTFTVSNLGNMGVESFTPVINPPQTGILGVCCTTERVRKAADGSLQVYSAMGLSLTYDHRAVDGSPAARFQKELAHNLENFTALLAK
jgi:pyruvate dehydrogenase E2 component (dihydrolipoamide acetyltransferase)